MKKNIFVRLLAALGGLMLWALAGLALAETFFHVPVTAFAGRVLGARTPLAVLIILAAAIVLFVLGLSCLMMLSSKRAAKRSGFVMQKGENGMIGVSIKSIEGLVQTCVKQHDVVASAEISVVEHRDGIVILLSIKEAAGVNIPLAVGALQKQIKQYVGTCTGVDVHEVRVLVENTETDAVESPYAVEKPVVLTTAATAANLHHEAPAMEEPVAEAQPMEEIQAEEEPEEIVPVPEETVQEESVGAEEEAPEEEPALVVDVPAAVAAPVVPVIPEIPEMLEEEDDRPLHQRLFGAEEQPVFVPAPPELVIEPAAEEVIEEPEAEAETAETAEEANAEDEIDANAVLEVVEAIAHEEELLMEELIPQAEEQPAEEASEEEDEPAEEGSEEASFEYDEEVLAEEASLDGAEEEDIHNSFTQDM